MSQEPDAERACVLVRTTVTDRSPRGASRATVAASAYSSSPVIPALIASLAVAVLLVALQSFFAACLSRTDQGRKAGYDAWGISRHARGTSSSRTHANCLPTGSSRRKVADPAVGSMSGLGSRACSTGLLRASRTTLRSVIHRSTLRTHHGRTSCRPRVEKVDSP